MKKLSVRGKIHDLTVLDTAGQERFRSLSHFYYRGAQGAILVYDVTNRATFEDLEHWYEEIYKLSVTGIITHLVGGENRHGSIESCHDRKREIASGEIRLALYGDQLQDE